MVTVFAVGVFASEGEAGGSVGGGHRGIDAILAAIRTAAITFAFV